MHETYPSHRFAVAPMMGCTDRHCRFLHRLMTRRALLYTEMMTASAIVNGDSDRLLAFDRRERPLALQLGGSDPKELGAAARIGVQAGYDEINLNAGCPSSRVKDGCFGAILMTMPERAAECASAMIGAAGGLEVTVKCRIGVDDCDPREMLWNFVRCMNAAGISRIFVHARKAWLTGLNPKANRNVPPLNYDLVFELKRDFPDLEIGINGGIGSLDDAERLLSMGLDGVMLGRAAYQSPADILPYVDSRIFGETGGNDQKSVVLEMLSYIEDHVRDGGKVHQITRHMLGLYRGCRGARLWRQTLSDQAKLSKKGSEAVQEALAYVT